MNPLPLDFYRRSSTVVAPELLGCFLVRRLGDKILSGKIVEVEAYKQSDPASHSFRGKTLRTEVMFRDGGHLYVYFTYGMHFCANIVTGVENTGEAVLLRAVEPITGIESMAWNRYRRHRVKSNSEFVGLTSGPARLCQAFGIDRGENGTSLTDGSIYVSQRPSDEELSIGRTQRIGISRGVDRKWRWFIAGNPWVSVDRGRR